MSRVLVPVKSLVRGPEGLGGFNSDDYTAVISARSGIAMNDIHPTVIIEGDVTLGDNNRILPYTVLTGPLEIGDDNIIGPHTVIGSPGQDTRNPRYESDHLPIKIGSGNIIREFTAIQKPAYEDLTEIGSNVFLMQSVHIPHDARIGDDVVITPMVSLAGLAKILPGANIGMGATIHQRCVVGAGSLVATGAAVTKNVRPYSIYIPNQPLRLNEYALEKFELTAFRDEAEAYVLRGEIPEVASPIRDALLAFESLHEASGRGLY